MVIGSVKLLNLQKKKLNFHIEIEEINSSFNLKNLKTNKLPVYNIDYQQKKPFQKISKLSNKYIFKSFDIGLNLLKNKKICGLINCPVYKETLFTNTNQGITEFLSKKTGVEGNEVMLIYNKRLSVSPITTHIPIRQVSRKISKKILIKKVQIINNFYKKNFKKKPKISILGLNPHNFSGLKKAEEEKIILPAIKNIKKMKIKAIGPIPPDTGFVFNIRNKPDVIVGMYHDQVLAPFKTLFKYDAINITLGLPFIRISPDHGVAENIVASNAADPKSLIESIKFFNLIK